MPTNGKTIIKDAVALCSYLSDYGVDQGNAIASTHSYEFDEKTPWNVIKEVADACQTSGGAVGFDGYVDAPGNLWIFQRNSSNSTVDLTDKIIRYKIDYDTYRVKNKIKVYGKDGVIGIPGETGYCIPSDKDSWTVDSLANWVAVLGELSINTADKVVGANCLQAWTGASGNYVHFRRWFSETISAVGTGLLKTLNLYVYIVDIGADIKKLRLLAPDTSNYFELNIETPTYGWLLKQYQLGTNQEYDATFNPNGIWNKVGNPNWMTLKGIEFYTHWANVNKNQLIDGLYFGHGRWRATASDSTSQGLYGVRMPEPITDDSLTSDDACLKKAQSLLSYYKDRVTTLTLTTFGDNGFKPGDRLHVVLSNDGIDDYFRILEVRHTLQDVLWQTELLLSNEPIMIDYIFRKMFEVQKTIASNQ